MLVAACDKRDLEAAVTHVRSGMRTFSFSVREIHVEADKSVQDIHSRSAQDGRQSASASSSWRASGWQEANESSGSHAPSPWPKLHEDDTRFEKAVRKRRIYCDSCAEKFTFQPIGFDGASVHKSYEAEAEERKTEALQVMHAKSMAGSWDATWWCSSCWLLLV